jgi:dolichol kinase
MTVPIRWLLTLLFFVHATGGAPPVEAFGSRAIAAAMNQYKEFSARCTASTLCHERLDSETYAPFGVRPPQRLAPQALIKRLPTEHQDPQTRSKRPPTLPNLPMPTQQLTPTDRVQQWCAFDYRPWCADYGILPPAGSSSADAKRLPPLQPLPDATSQADATAAKAAAAIADAEQGKWRAIARCAIAYQPSCAAYGVAPHGFRPTLPAFLATEAIAAAAYLLSSFLLGWAVLRYHWNANYTRKLVGGLMLAVPYLALDWFPYAALPVHILLSYVIFFLLMLIFIAPLRRRSRFLTVAFASFDRPEDRPHTLTWLMTAFVASAVILLTMMWWAVPQAPAYVFIAFIAVAVGDLLAGVVGFRFGRHRFTTRALFTSKTYTRSLEGSACVFLTTVAAILYMHSNNSLPAAQLWPALAILPLALTIAEAKSPHTWDEPVMFLTAMVAAMGIIKVW